MRLARARGEALLNPTGADRAPLEALAVAPDAPFHVVAGATRWLIALEPSRADDARARLDQLARDSERVASGLPRVLALLDLDAALRAGHPGDAARAVTTLSEVEPQPLAILRAGRDRARWPDEPAYVRRFYPY